MTKKEYDKLSKKLADIDETLKDETLLANVRDILTLEREDLIKQMEAYQPKEVDAKEIKESLNGIKNTLAVIIILIILALLIAGSQMLNQFQNDQNIMNILNNQSCELDEIKNNYSNVTDTDQYLYEEPEVSEEEHPIEEQQTPIVEEQPAFEEQPVENQQTFEEQPVGESQNFEKNPWNNNDNYENANSKYNATEGFEEQDTNTYYSEYANNTDEPLLGVLVTETPSELYNSTNVPEGVYVYKVQRHTGAYAAGLQDGDIITSVDNQRVYSLDNIKKILRSYSKGDSVNVEVTHYPYEEFNQSNYYVTLH